MTGKRPAKRRRSRRGPPRHRKPAPVDAPPCVLRLERFASGGDAVATREDGKTVFVEDGVPGDLVRARIIDERKRFARACVVEVLEPSADRVAAPCRHFGVCGGCAWQHVAYPAQVRAKAAILKDALERIGGFALDAVPPVTASPLEYGYRGRTRIHVEGERVGFLQRGSHRLCAVSACPVLVPALERAILDPGFSSLGELPDAEPDTRKSEWSACVGVDDRISKVKERRSESAEEASARPGLAADLDPDPGPEPEIIEIEVGARPLQLDARAFSQANRSMHGPLLERVLAVLFEGVTQAVSRRWSVLEIHAGIGFFTASIVSQTSHVVAVEASPEGCAWLERNLHGVVDDNESAAEVEIFEGTFTETASRLTGRAFDAVVLDPPRSGLAPEEVTALIELAPQRIVYLSCDPATQARDARLFADAGWRLDHVEGFDLFPQTPHTEGLIRLVLDAGTVSEDS